MRPMPAPQSTARVTVVVVVVLVLVVEVLLLCPENPMNLESKAFEVFEIGCRTDS